jgi:tRNA 2-thiouridine synthesizing protein E
MEKVIAGQAIQVNEEGYLTDFKQWNKEVCAEMAKDANIRLFTK